MKQLFFYAALIVCAFGLAQTELTISSEEILVMNDSIKLPGTLTYPSEKKKMPLVIVIHGSGPNGRDGNPPRSPTKLDYLKNFAAALNAKGIAVFRYDKRSFTSENYKFAKNTTITDLAEDVDKVIEKLQENKLFSSITLIGHSQGSLLGMLTKNKPTKYISLAGPSDTIDQAIIRQIDSQSPVFGEKTKKYFKELAEKGRITKVDPLLRSIFDEKNLPFLQDWMSYNPSEIIKTVKVPTLIINGSLDSQVRVLDAETLHKSKPDADLVIIPKLNHLLFEVANKEQNLLSYQGVKFPISEELITTIEKFIKR